MKKTRNKKGITLVALIITIIVLLILAVVAIRAVQGDGIIAHAKNAREGYKESSNQENVILDSYLSQIEDDLGIIPSVGDLQDRYEFHYYSSFNKAVTDTNNQTINNADATQDDASAAIYDKDNEKVIVLMKDITESAQININENTTINLGGHLLASTAQMALAVQQQNAGITLKIDGRLPGSVISVESSSQARAIGINEGNTLIINGGTYTAKGTGATAGIYNAKNSNLSVSNASIEAKSSQAQAFGVLSFGFKTIKNSTINISGYSGASMGVSVDQRNIENKVVGVIDGVKIQASSDIGNSVGLWINSAEVIVQNADIFADASNNAAGKPYSEGIENKGILHFRSGSVGGTLAGLGAYNGSKTYITGGEFYSCSHGGIYFAQGESGEAYVSNATISCVEYTGKYDATKFTNSQLGGFYIGDTSNANVYMDKCTIRGGSKAFVLRGTDTGTNNKLYISNSTIGDNQIRIDNETLRVYIGKDTNITTDKIDHPEWSEFTNEEYSHK